MVLSTLGSRVYIGIGIDIYIHIRESKKLTHTLGSSSSSNGQCTRARVGSCGARRKGGGKTSESGKRGRERGSIGGQQRGSTHIHTHTRKLAREPKAL